ncbi:MAG: VOC family protein [Clostridium sp.]|nr:VOC family protein [Clostridium sp.]
MLNYVEHIGITVSNLEKSLVFYRDVLGLNYKGEMIMNSKETEILFGIKNCIVKVAYLNCNDLINGPEIELIQFISEYCVKRKSSLNITSISELCFNVLDIEQVYNKLKSSCVSFISPPQFFDLSSQGFGKSKAVYLKDPDGIILELIEHIN